MNERRNSKARDTFVHVIRAIRNDGRRIFGLAAAALVPITIKLAFDALSLPSAALIQAMYVPIVLAAVGVGVSGAMAAAATAALVVPAPAIGFNGATEPWVVQMIAFFGFAMLTGFLFKPTIQKAWRRTEYGVSSQDRVLSSLANTVEVRDHHTQGHCERVASNAVVLGEAMGYAGKDLETLYWSALLHDLGKIAVPEYILQKHGRLTEEEFSEIRRHPSYGADLLASISTDYRPMADVVRAHHERWDGEGYPLGCRGEEIPLMARIIAVVDVFEALTSDRPYRSPMPPEKAMQYLRRGAGSQFDPQVVPLFEALFERGEILCASTEALPGRSELAERPVPMAIRNPQSVA